MFAGERGERRSGTDATVARRARSAGLVAGSAAGAVVLLCITAAVLILAKLNADSRFELLRDQVRSMALSAAQLVDGDLHNRIRAPAQMQSPAYARAITGLVKFHNANPDLFYVYTMIENDGHAYFILDTAADPRLRSKRMLVPSVVMEAFEPDPAADQTAWLAQLRSGKPYVNADFETDDYGTFISGHAPFYDSSGTYAGFVGIDVDANFFLKRQRTLDQATLLVLAIGVVLAVGSGGLVYRLHRESVLRAAEIEQLTLTDPLTEAWNRRGLAQRAAQAFKEFRRQARPLSLLVIDIDHFKRLNDSYGHATGDEVLKLLVRVTRSVLREVDFLARTGGEEFVAVLSETDVEGARQLGERVRAALSEAVLPLAAGGEVRFTVSIGVSACRSDDGALDDCLGRADAALYEAKGAGRDRVVAKP